MMEESNNILLKYAELWERARQIIGSYFDYLENYALTESEEEQVESPISNLRDFNVIITCLKRTMESHRISLIPEDVKDENGQNSNGEDSAAINSQILRLLEKYQENGNEETTD